MTPERKEEINYLIGMSQEQFESFVDAGEYTDQQVIDLWSENKRMLSALEEAQQQRDIAQANYKTYYAEATEVSKQLSEAQQTIARLTNELNEMTNDRDLWRSNSTY